MDVKCQTCGNLVKLDEWDVKFICEYCERENYVNEKAIEKIIPFSIENFSEDKVKQSEEEYINLDNFDFNKIKKHYIEISSITSEIKYKYTVFNIFTDEEKIMKEFKEEQYSMSVEFEEKLKLKNYFLDEAINYKEDYLYGIDVIQNSKNKIIDKIKKNIENEVYEKSNVENIISIDIAVEKSKNILVPIYSIKNDEAIIYINGQSGHIFNIRKLIKKKLSITLKILISLFIISIPISLVLKNYQLILIASALLILKNYGDKNRKWN